MTDTVFWEIPGGLRSDDTGGEPTRLVKKAGGFENLSEEGLGKGRYVSRVERVGGKLEVGIGRPSAYL